MGSVGLLLMLFIDVFVSGLHKVNELGFAFYIVSWVISHLACPSKC